MAEKRYTLSMRQNVSRFSKNVSRFSILIILSILFSTLALALVTLTSPGDLLLTNQEKSLRWKSP